MMACSGAAGTEEVAQPLCDNTTAVCPCPGSPIVIDVAGDGVELTSLRDGVKFGLRPGTTGSVSWTSIDSDDAWLVMDRNGNGAVDDGSEMFGNFTLQPPLQQGEQQKNGFRALALLDANRDGSVDKLDPEFEQLRLWRDIDHDGISLPDELFALPALGVEGLSVEYSPSTVVDQHGNRFVYRAAVDPAPGSTVGMTAWDVWLVGTRPVRTSDAPAALRSAFYTELCETADLIPDLRPSILVAPPPTVRLNDCFGFSWRTRNIGTGAADSHHWAVYLNGQELRTQGTAGRIGANGYADFGAVICPPYHPYNINFVSVYVNTPDPPPPAPPVGNGSLVEISYTNNFVSAAFSAAD